MPENEKGFAGILFIIVLCLTLGFLYIAYKQQNTKEENTEETVTETTDPQSSPSTSATAAPPQPGTTNTQNTRTNPTGPQFNTQATGTPYVQYTISPTQSYTAPTAPVSSGNTSTPTPTSKSKGNGGGGGTIVIGG